MRIRTFGIVLAILLGGGSVLQNQEAKAQSCSNCSTVCIEEVPISGSTTYSCKADGEPISLTVSDNTRIIRIRSSGGTSRIGRITLSGSRSGSESIDLLLVRGVDEFSEFVATDNLAAAGTHWGGLTGSESVLSKVRLAAAVSGNIPGTVDPPPNETEIGNVTCGTIVRLQVGTPSTFGKIGGEVTTTGSIADSSVVAIGMVQANEISETGVLRTGTGGVLSAVQVGYSSAPGAGWLAGTIDASSGRIGTIDVFGPIGSSSQTATIEAEYGITSIIAHPDGDGLPQPVWADIDASNADSLVDFALLRCGDFTGTFHAGTGANLSSVDTPEIFIDGNLAGPLAFEGELRIPIRIEGACLAGSSINIGGSVLASITSVGDLADILIEGDVLSQSGQPDIHIRSDTGRIEEIKVYGNILSDDADGSGHNIFLEAAEGFGWIEAKSIVAFIGSPLGAGNFVPIDNLSSVPGGAVSEFDGEVWCSSFETFDIENPVGNLVSLGHIINFLEVPQGLQVRLHVRTRRRCPRIHRRQKADRRPLAGP